LTARGWHLQPQPAIDGLKENLHLTITPQHAPNMDALLADLREVADLVRGRAPSELVANMKGMLENMKPEDLTADGLQNVLAMAGLGGDPTQAPDVPERMAEINELLQAMPPEVADKLLTGFYNELSQYRKKED
jgi:sphinganine-1-phosphate aldolase